MQRYRIVAYYLDKVTDAQVAQTLVVIAPDDRQAIQLATRAVSVDAVDDRLAAIEVTEKGEIKPGVVYRSDPYIPFRWIDGTDLAGEAKPSEQ